MKLDKYFLGLDIGTDSVGYAVTDTSELYKIPRHNRNLMWGVHLFDEANLKQERRSFRTSRRRLERRQHRVKLLQELFSREIAKVDPLFYRRLHESALWRDDSKEPYAIFNDVDYTDKQYHKDYPTIHHLICDLMNNDAYHDVRLVYLACAWLIVHRGHFLSSISEDNIEKGLKFDFALQNLIDYLDSSETAEALLSPWKNVNNQNELAKILVSNKTVTSKTKEIKQLLYGGSKLPKAALNDVDSDDETSFVNMELVIKLICGGTVSCKDLFGNAEYEDIASFSLSKDDEVIDETLKDLGDDGELIVALKGIFDWSVLSRIMGKNDAMISEAKVAIYDQHKKDLKYLKQFVRKYIPAQYNEIFNLVKKDLNNYVSYSGMANNCKNVAELKKSDKALFSDYLKKQIKGVEVEPEDVSVFEDMKLRLDTNTFLPKQVEGDNRVLPYQLYYVELRKILDNACKYLPFLLETDSSGFSTKEKILAIMKFRVPYFVGPIKSKEYGWAVLNSGKESERLYPWNFDKIVDLDKSENEFIRRMMNTCTYLPGEEVLAKNSLLYQKFEVLNEINNLKINGIAIPVSVKQRLYSELFCQRKKVSLKQIKEFLKCNGICSCEEAETLSGIDTTIKSTLSSYAIFKRMLANNILTEPEVEEIIERRTFTEDGVRFRKWLNQRYSKLSEDDRLFISKNNFKDFGRLSKKLLSGIEGVDKETGETGTIMHFLWETNDNLQVILLGNRYSFPTEIEEFRKEYYRSNPVNFEDRLNELYVSNTVKRQILRTFDVVQDIVKTAGKIPEKIFVEMARGGKPEDKGKRTKTRKQQLLELYASVKETDVKLLEEQLEKMGDNADTLLQSDMLFLYYIQLGKCMYSGAPIDVEKLKDGTYNVDHIYPQSKVKDDSILNNKVLVLSQLNEEKGDNYPIKADWRQKMRPFWDMLKKNGLITEEKYLRLIRNKPFSDDEKWEFINRQLTETRQSTKVIAMLLKEKYPTADVVYVKAGLVSDFRKENEFVKARSVNDLHHAKDAFLNIVCGNVYNSFFTKKWFEQNKDTSYTINTKVIFHGRLYSGGKCYWDGNNSLAAITQTMHKNWAHMVPYTYVKAGGFYDQNPLKASSTLVPRKRNLPAEKYGGYAKPSASCYTLVSFTSSGKKDLAFIPIELLYLDRFLKDRSFAIEYVRIKLAEISQNNSAESVSFILDSRLIKINTVFEVDGYRMILAGKSSGGEKVLLKSFTPLVVDEDLEVYIKKLEKMKEKASKLHIIHDERYDCISKDKNIALFDYLVNKLSVKPYCLKPGLQIDKIRGSRDRFDNSNLEEQAAILLNLISLFSRSVTKDSTLGTITSTRLSYKMSNWKKNYSSACIVDLSPSGITEKKSMNLLDLI